MPRAKRCFWVSHSGPNTWTTSNVLPWPLPLDEKVIWDDLEGHTSSLHMEKRDIREPLRLPSMDDSTPKLLVWKMEGAYITEFKFLEARKGQGMNFSGKESVCQHVGLSPARPKAHLRLQSCRRMSLHWVQLLH